MLSYLSDFDQSQISLNIDVVLITSVFQVVINLLEMSAEGFVGVDNSQTRGFPADFASLLLRIPLGLRNQKVIINDLAVEVVRRDVEISWPSVEVEMHSIALVGGGLPRAVVLVGVERVDYVCPSLIEPFYLIVVFLLPESQHQILILNRPAVSEDHFVFGGVDLFDSNVVRLAVVLAHHLPGG